MDLNRRYSDNDPCWLVKVDTKISGPWSFNEVLVKLTKGELQPFHEASSPMDRWRSLQSQPLFAAAIERLKKQGEVPSEYTSTSTTRTELTSFTRTLDLKSDALTQTPMSARDTLTPTPTPPPNFPPQAPPPMRPAPQSYNSDPSIFYKEPKKNYTTVIAIAVGAAVLGVVLFLISGKKTEPQGPGKNQFIEYVDHGLAFKKSADWYEALKQFKKAYQINSKDIDLVFEMAPLLVQVESQTMYSRNMIEKMLQGQYKKENLSVGKNILGLSYAYENQHKMALKYYGEILKDDDTYFPAMVNSGYAHLLSGNYSDAESILIEAANNQPTNVIPYIYLMQVYVIDGVKNKNNEALQKAFDLAQKNGDKFYDGQQEMLLFQAYAALKLNKEATVVQNLLQNALLMDPDQTSDHLHSPLLDWRGLDWSHYSYVCRDFTKVAKPDQLSLLEFVCTYKTNEMASQQLVSGWMNRSPNSSWPHVAQAVISLRLGEFEKSRMSLALAQKAGANDKLYFETLMKVCARTRDLDCLRKNFAALSKASSLHAQLSLAVENRISENSNKKPVYDGLRESSNYIPLLRMQ